jgi:hypothetical protein
MCQKMNKCCDHVPRHTMQKPTKLKSTSNFNCTFPKIIFHCHVTCPVDQESKVGLVTCYGLEGSGIKSWWEAKFSTDQSWSSPSLQSNGYQVSFLGVKQLWHGVDHPPPSRVEVKERVHLLFYSFSGSSCPFLG